MGTKALTMLSALISQLGGRFALNGRPKRVGQSFAGLMLILHLSPAWGARFWYFDIDGTLFHDSGLNEEGKEPAWWSYWILTRMSSVSSGLFTDTFEEGIRSGNLPEQVIITRHEYDELVRGKLATAQERQNSFDPIELTQDPINETSVLDENGRNYYTGLNLVRPKVLIPGFYLLIPEIAFKLHDTTGENHLLRTYLAAQKRMDSNPARFELRGPAFADFARALSQQDELNRVFLMTDRNATTEAALEMLQAMHRRGLIPNPVRVVDGKAYHPKVYSMSSPSARAYGSIRDFDLRKANFIGQQMRQLNSANLSEHQVASLDRNDAAASRTMHELIVWENRPEYVNPIAKEVKGIAAALPKVKVTLAHAGSPAQIAAFAPQGYQSRYFVFTASGVGIRQPSHAEIKELAMPARAPLSRASIVRSCEKVMMDLTGENSGLRGRK